MPSLSDIVETFERRLSVLTKKLASMEGGRSFVGLLANQARRAGRSFVRYAEGIPNLPRGFGHGLAVAFIAVAWFAGSVVGGSSTHFVSGTAAVLGLKTTDIVITGQVETRESEVFEALAVGQSLVGFDTLQARSRVMELPWVKDVAIRKLYPGKLTVALAEKRAMAVWQYNEKLTVVEHTGKPITQFGIADLISNRFSHLPHLVGDGAPAAAAEILPLAAKYPFIAKRVKSYVRMGDRRWDMALNNGIRIQLPEHDVASAMAHVAKLADEDRLLEREVEVVDLRVHDRVVLRLLPQAAKTRGELVSARLKAMKKADRKL